MANSNEKPVSAGCFDGKQANIRGFCEFCRKNIPLVIAVTIALFFAYGGKLLYHTIGEDTERYIASGKNVLFTSDDNTTGLRWINQGRFGLVWLQKLYIREFNPYAAFFVTFCFIWLFTVSWCYVIALCGGKDKERNNTLIPFALVFMTSPVWAEQFYWVLQSAEVSFIVLLCPYVIYLLFQGIFDNSRIKTTAAVMLLIFMTSVYQAIVFLFCCGAAACFILMMQNKKYDARGLWRDVLKIIAAVLAAMIVYFALNNLVIALYKGEKEYVPFAWRTAKHNFTIKETLLYFLFFGYRTTIGGIPAVQKIVESFIVRFARSGTSVAHWQSMAKIFGNVLLIPLAVLFLVQTGKNAARKTAVAEKTVYFAAGASVILSVFILPCMPGGSAMRSQFALPFATAFMFWYLIQHYQKKLSAICIIAALFVAMYQAQTTAQLFYSDYIRYNEDVRLAADLDRRIIEILDGDEKTPVALVGKYTLPFEENFLKGEALGFSVFEWSSSGVSESGRHGLPFMRVLGFNYELADPALMEKARAAALSMPSYPAPGSCLRLPDVIVVKFSDSTYVPEK